MTGTGDVRPVPDPTTLTTEALHREVKATRDLLDAHVGALDRLVMDKFAAAEAHRLEQKADTNERINAALAAVKDENVKTAATFDTAIGGLTTNLNDLKDRMTKAEGNTGGQAQARSNLYAGLSAAVALLVIIGTVLAFMARGG